MNASALRPLALTLGEPAGIGPDLALALWTQRAILKLPPFLLLGDPEFLVARARQLRLDVKIAETTASEATSRFGTALPVQPVGVRATAAAGKPNDTSAKVARTAIENGVHLVATGAVSALVTNPIAKSVMQRAGFPFPGHTEFLAELAAPYSGNAPRPVMLIWSEDLSVVPVTIHVPLRDVPRLLSVDLIVETGRIVARDLAQRFGVARPRLAVCGLNPHAGEHGLIGREEDEIIRPAIDRLKAEGVDATGPHPADALFHPAARKGYDVAMGMYHDQVLAPVKTLAFDRAVNVTLGLPFIRTSPDHGTALDLAGTGKGDPSSLLAALRLAQRLAESRVPAGAK
jgi:4-hydroxythreonine-4-phosphate dehydrogenase